MPDYQIIKKLGNGHFGEVILVKDAALDVFRAVKTVPHKKISNPSNFYQEPQLLMALRHPNVVRVEDAGLTSEGIYIAMEYLPEGSIIDKTKGECLPITQAVKIVSDVCRGLEYAHHCGYIHRDIKPGNILLHSDGYAKLSDFGLAASLDPDGTATPGAYNYCTHLAPEVIEDSITSPLTDIYALGITLYRLVNGEELFDSTIPQDQSLLEDQIISGKFPNRGTYKLYVSKKLKSIINKACHVDPSKRFQSASAFRHALERLNIHSDWQETTKGNITEWKTQFLGKYYLARMTKNIGGTYSFELLSGRSSSNLRYDRNKSLERRSRLETLKHVNKVLTSITG